MSGKYNKKFLSYRISTVLVYVVFALLFFIIMLLSPHTVDDIYYDYLNFNSIKDIFSFSVGYGNGRVLGNSLGIVLSKSAVLAAFIRTLCLILLSFFISRIVISVKMGIVDKTNGKDERVILLVHLFIIVSLLLISPVMFGENYAWISGFANYLPPVVCMVINTYLVIKYIKAEKNSVKLFIILLIAVISFLGQFFSENSSVYNIVLPIFICIILFVFNKDKMKKTLPSLLVWVGAAVLGLAIMLYIRTHMDSGVMDVKGYASIHIFDIEDMVDTILSNIYDCYVIIRENYFTIVVISLMLVKLLNTDNICQSKNKYFNIFISVYLLAFSVYNIVDANMMNPSGRYDFIPSITAIHFFISTVLFAMYILAVIYVIGCLKNKKAKFILSGALLFAIFTATSILVLEPIGARCYYTTVILLIFFSAVLLGITVETISPKIKKYLIRLLSGMLLLTFIFLTPLYMNFAMLDSYIDEYARYEISCNADSIKIPRISKGDYFHAALLKPTYGYKYYREVPKDVEFVEVGIQDWMQNYYKYGNYKNE